MSEGLALTHGANDAQKAVGVVALLLVAGGQLSHLESPTWVELACSLALTAIFCTGASPTRLSRQRFWTASAGRIRC